jgi:diacylglycerol kinase (ATP)
MTAPHFTFILNPVAGRGKAKHIHAALMNALEQSAFDYTFHITTGPGHATTLAREASTHSSIVIAIGGDGTVNEVASGLTGTKCAMAVMSEGSGNDFARIVSAPHDPQKLISILRDPVIRTFDAGTITMVHANGETTTRSFFNSVGIGFDAAVARRVSTIRWLRGIPLYLTALLQTIAGYQPHVLSVRCNGSDWTKNYFLLCIGNGKWEGGGFMLTPNAAPDDGMFEVCGVTGDSILKVLPVLPSVMSGTHLGKNHIESFDTTALSMQCTSGVPIHGDGEIFGMQVVSADVKILPGSLQVVVPHRA